jgi:thymidylate synthase
MHLIEGKTADEVWLIAAQRIRSRRDTLQQVSRGGDTLELLHSCLVVARAVDRWVLNRRPAMNPAFALAEVVWILSGRDDAGFLNFWNPVLPNFAGRGPLYYGAYGHRLRYRFGIDQIRYAYEALRAQPDSRQVVLQIWDSASDLPIENGQPRSPDIPCNVCSLLKIREGRLEWVQVMRSNDLKLGWPHNVVQFTTLQEMMAGWLKVEVGAYTHFSDSLHVYADQLEELVEPVELTLEQNTDRWTLPYAETMDVIEDLGRRMDSIRGSAGDLATIQRAGVHDYPTMAATNALALIAADAARRVRAPALAEDLANRCTNPILRQLWRRWSERRHPGKEETDADES